MMAGKKITKVMKIIALISVGVFVALIGSLVVALIILAIRRW